MCTLAPDSLLTGLPGLVKATGSFSETKHATHPFIPTTNVYPPLQLFIYLSIHVAFHFSLLFSAVFLPDPRSALKETRGFLAAGSFFFFFFYPTCHDSLIAKISLKPLLISREASKNHILRAGQSSTGIRCDSSVSFCLLQGCVRLS